MVQGLKYVLSASGQLDVFFWASNLIIILTSLMCKVCLVQTNKLTSSKLRLAQEKQDLRSTCTCPKGKLEFMLFLSPVVL